MLRYMTDRARPGLVAFYDIWPGNGVGLFLQPWNPHGADGGGGDNRSYKTCKAPVKSLPITNQHPTFHRPDALPVVKVTVSKY